MARSKHKRSNSEDRGASQPIEAQSNLFRGSDSELAQLLRRDPARGGTALFERYEKRVEHVLARLLGTDSEIADLVHDVFLTALMSIHRLRREDALGSWLAGIAANKARNLVRKRRAFPLTHRDVVLELPDPHAYPPGLNATEALRRTHRLLLRLATEERSAFTLRQLDIMSFDELAQEMHVSVSTVKRRAERGRCTFVRWASCDSVLAEWLKRGTLV